MASKLEKPGQVHPSRVQKQRMLQLLKVFPDLLTKFDGEHYTWKKMAVELNLLGKIDRSAQDWHEYFKSEKCTATKKFCEGKTAELSNFQIVILELTGKLSENFSAQLHIFMSHDEAVDGGRQHMTRKAVKAMKNANLVLELESDSDQSRTLNNSGAETSQFDNDQSGTRKKTEAKANSFDNDQSRKLKKTEENINVSSECNIKKCIPTKQDESSNEELKQESTAKDFLEKFLNIDLNDTELVDRIVMEELELLLKKKIHTNRVLKALVRAKQG